MAAIPSADAAAAAQGPSSINWKDSLSFSDRCENVLRIAACLKESLDDIDPGAELQTAAQEAECRAFAGAIDRPHYNRILTRSMASTVQRANPASAFALPPTPSWAVACPPTDLSPRFTGCLPFARGVSSVVFTTKSAPGQVIKAVCRSPPQPHNALREVVLLNRLSGSRGIVQMVSHFDVTGAAAEDYSWGIVMPYYNYSLEAVLEREPGPMARPRIQSIFMQTFAALAACHKHGIIHRDIKPSAILMSSPDGPVVLSDFGASYAPDTHADEGPGTKLLDIGTGPYRCPDALFGIRDYTCALDWWAAGAVLAEACLPSSSRPLFKSPPAHEDGSQLSLIRSIFQTLGTPTAETWPSAAACRPVPWEMWVSFPAHPWHLILPDVDEDIRDLVAGLVQYEAKKRPDPDSAMQALGSPTGPGLV